MKRRAGPGAYPSSRAVSAPAFLSFAGLAIIPATGLVVVIAVHLDRRIRCHWFKAVNAHLVTATAARAAIARARIRKVGRLPLVTIGALKRVLWQLVSHLGFLAPDACLLAIGLVFVGGAAAATQISVYVRWTTIDRPDNDQPTSRFKHNQYVPRHAGLSRCMRHVRSLAPALEG